jgi:hypothetical protein
MNYSEEKLFPSLGMITNLVGEPLEVYLDMNQSQNSALNYDSDGGISFK